MSYAQIAQMLNAVGIPTAYDHFTDKTAQKPPFLVFFYDNVDDVYADNANFQRIVKLNVELYTDNKDFALESTLEGVLTANALTYTKEESYIDSERMYQIAYESEVLING